MSALENLSQFSTLVADTGDLAFIRESRLSEATTNPSLVLQAVQSTRGRAMMKNIFQEYPKNSLAQSCERLLVRLGAEILRMVPGRVSTEVDPRLSFDSRQTVEQARRFVAEYEKLGISKQRVLVKIAATWEGIRAAEVLEQEKIHCNLTLVFSLTQALACAQAGVTMVSPFVGRVCDWHMARGALGFSPEHDPGVVLVREVYRLLKERGYHTQVMGASFRSVGQVLALVGCDFLTVSPAIWNELRQTSQEVSRQLSPKGVGMSSRQGEQNDSLLDETSFRWLLNEDAMAMEKLAEGIRRFAEDARRVEAFAQTWWQSCQEK